jgi:tetratricopeptide (TPR) repeat protein
MPLIDTVIELTVKKREKDVLLVAEKDGTEYLFNPGQGDYIENETLSVRVTGLDRNLELGKKDVLLGVVVAAELKVTEAIRFPADMMETGTWDPAWQYGPTAAKDFFPDHYNRKWRVLVFTFPSTVPEEDIKTIQTASERLQEGRLDEGKEMISSVLGKIPWLLDLYHVMGVLSLNGRKPETAWKYFQMGIVLAESVLPDTDDFVLDYMDSRNGFYMSHLHSLADLSVRMGQKEEAVELYGKIYRLMPYDPGCAREQLRLLTGKSYPQTGEAFEGLPVDPYRQFDDYPDFPLHDSYDPESRTDYVKWLRWEESYRHLLILNAHLNWFAANKFSEKNVIQHILLHDIAETTLAREEHPEMRLNMARSIAQGTSRHEIIHQLGQAVFARLQAEYDQQNPSDSSPE